MQTFYGPISNELFFFFFFKGYCFGGFFGRKLGNEAIDTMQSLRTGPPIGRMHSGSHQDRELTHLIITVLICCGLISLAISSITYLE